MIISKVLYEGRSVLILNPAPPLGASLQEGLSYVTAWMSSTYILSYLCKGVFPLKSFECTWAPCLMSNSKIFLFFRIVATCRGVCRDMFCASISAPCCVRTWHMATLPAWTAMWSAVFWAASFWFTNCWNSGISLADLTASAGWRSCILWAIKRREKDRWDSDGRLSFPNDHVYLVKEIWRLPLPFCKVIRKS